MFFSLIGPEIFSCVSRYSKKSHFFVGFPIALQSQIIFFSYPTKIENKEFLFKSFYIIPEGTKALSMLTHINFILPL